MHKHLRRVCKRYYSIGNVQVHFIYNNNDDCTMANNLMFHLYLDQFISTLAQNEALTIITFNKPSKFKPNDLPF